MVLIVTNTLFALKRDALCQGVSCVSVLNIIYIYIAKKNLMWRTDEKYLK